MTCGSGCFSTMLGGGDFVLVVMEWHLHSMVKRWFVDTQNDLLSTWQDKYSLKLSLVSTAWNILFSSFSGSVMVSATFISNSVRILLLLSSCSTEVIKVVSCGSL